MACDLKKLGWVFFFLLFLFISPWDETFCANDISWYEHNADVGVCHEDACNSPCPRPPSQEGSKHSEVTPWAVSCQTRDPRYQQGGGVAVNWGGGLQRGPLFAVVSLTHQKEDTLLASIRAAANLLATCFVAGRRRKWTLPAVSSWAALQRWPLNALNRCAVNQRGTHNWATDPSRDITNI